MAEPLTPPTAEDLARGAEADLRVCNAASPGPWSILGGCTDDNAADHYCLYIGPTLGKEVLWAYGRNRTGNCQFASMARTALSAWIRRAIAAEARVKVLEAVLLDPPETEETEPRIKLPTTAGIEQRYHHGHHQFRIVLSPGSIPAWPLGNWCVSEEAAWKSAQRRLEKEGKTDG